jgi:mannose-6-phosphate isomerase-like protein (cupin superfamily)
VRYEKNSHGESTTILRGQLHRIENKSDRQAVIFEVQNGEYLGEDEYSKI